MPTNSMMPACPADSAELSVTPDKTAPPPSHLTTPSPGLQVFLLLFDLLSLFVICKLPLDQMMPSCPADSADLSVMPDISVPPHHTVAWTAGFLLLSELLSGKLEDFQAQDCSQVAFW